MNVLATSLLTKAITHQTYRARNSTYMSATPHGTRSHQPRREPARQSSTLHTHTARTLVLLLCIKTN